MQRELPNVRRADVLTLPAIKQSPGSASGAGPSGGYMGTAASGLQLAYHRCMEARETAPSPERNKQPILEVLARVLPSCGLVLEIGSGTGQHVAHFAKALPALTFRPSEMDVERHASIEAWAAAGNLSNVKPPLAIDVTKRPWPVSAADGGRRQDPARRWRACDLRPVHAR